MNTNKKWIALRSGLLTAAAVMLILSAAMGSAWAYFTTYATSKGSHIIHMGHHETITEDFSDWEKQVRLELRKDSQPSYVRAKGFCADYKLSYSGSNWMDGGDGWWYYNRIMAPIIDEKTGEPGPDVADILHVGINKVPGTDKDGDSFNVIIVYESAPVQYNADGTALGPKEIDWNSEVVTKRTGGGE